MSSTSDWDNRSITEIIEHILDNEHPPLRARLTKLARALAEVVRTENQRNHYLVSIATELDLMHDDLVAHLQREERVLFPCLLMLDRGVRPTAPMDSIRRPIARLNAEHRVTEQTFERIRNLTANRAASYQPSSAMTHLHTVMHDLERELRGHADLESRILFVKAEALIAT